MDALMHEIATNAADYAVGKWGQHLTKGQQVTLWKRYFDSSLASLMTLDEICQSNRARARAIASEN